MRADGSCTVALHSRRIDIAGVMHIWSEEGENASWEEEELYRRDAGRMWHGPHPRLVAQSRRAAC